MSPTYAQKQKTAQKKEASTAAAVLDVSSQSEALQRKISLTSNIVQRAGETVPKGPAGGNAPFTSANSPLPSRSTSAAETTSTTTRPPAATASSNRLRTSTGIPIKNATGGNPLFSLHFFIKGCINGNSNVSDTVIFSTPKYKNNYRKIPF